MLYLLDANVLIDAHRDYYPLERVPEFWDWLLDRGATQQVKIPLEMYEEILVGKEDDLTRWLNPSLTTRNRRALESTIYGDTSAQVALQTCANREAGGGQTTVLRTPPGWGATPSAA